MREIKAFVDMMEERGIKCNEDFKVYGGNYNKGYVDSLVHLTAQSEYIALKSLANAPVAKVEVKDDILEVATRAHLKAAAKYMESQGQEPLNENFPDGEWEDLKSVMKIALEAVFSMQEPINCALKLIHAEKPAGKFTAYYNDGSGANLFYITDAGEILDAEGDIQDEDCLDNYSHWFPLPDNFEFFGPNDYIGDNNEKAEKQLSSDEWITWDNQDYSASPDLQSNARVYTKWRSGETYTHGIGMLASGLKWHNIIAYRII